MRADPCPALQPKVATNCSRFTTPQCGLLETHWGGNTVRTGTFGTAGDGLDVITTSAQLNSVFAAAGQVKVVTSMFGVCNAAGGVLGCGRSGASLIITTGAAADVWIHEWGHVRGLGHNDTDVRYIMHSTAPNTDSVTKAECVKFKP